MADQYITKRDFNKETASRKEFLRRQWVFCNSITEDIFNPRSLNNASASCFNAESTRTSISLYTEITN